MRYLKSINEISENDPKEKIMRLVFENQMSMNNTMIFKKDFLIYMILLSALVKTNSYKNENEIRIVYFEGDLSVKKTKEEDYEIKTIAGQSYMRPFVNFASVKMFDVIDEVIVSPLTHNVPIDDSLYKEVLMQFLRKHNFINTIVKISEHKCRW